MKTLFDCMPEWQQLVLYVGSFVAAAALFDWAVGFLFELVRG